MYISLKTNLNNALSLTLLIFVITSHFYKLMRSTRYSFSIACNFVSGKSYQITIKIHFTDELPFSITI